MKTKGHYPPGVWNSGGEQKCTLEKRKKNVSVYIKADNISVHTTSSPGRDFPEGKNKTEAEELTAPR